MKMMVYLYWMRVAQVVYRIRRLPRTTLCRAATLLLSAILLPW